ncbi:MAG: virulence factor BrkB family protein [Wenzhouxiangellaceae bacterium]|nr:virulence factor BrkB family protein [Wenzhouxiangellaceae bacterium]
MNSETSTSTRPEREPGPVAALLDPHWLKAFGRHLWQHFRSDHCFEAAAALTYTSLLALVPLMAVMLGVVSAFPVFDYGVEQLQDFIFSNFVPAAGDTIQEYLNQFISRASGLTGMGTLFLVVTAVVLMSTIEKILNRIWRVDQPRRPSSRIIVYWAVLTLGPLLLGASLGLTSYVAALPLLAPEFARGWIQAGMLALTPFLVALLAFTLIFMIVPNRRVSWHHALAGAAFSALAFEISKRGFVLYVSNFPTYEKLYGALAAIPIFLIWIYVSWIVILLGASLSAALTTFRFRRVSWHWNPRHYLLLCIRIIGHLWQAQRRGKALSSAKLLSLELAATDTELHLLLGRLHENEMVQRDDSGDWFLSVDLAEVTLDELYRSMPLVLPLTEIESLPENSIHDQKLIEALREIRTVAGPLFEQPLKSFLGRGKADANSVNLKSKAGAST